MLVKKNKYFILIFILYLTLLFGLFISEDLLQGAKIDYTNILTNKLSLFKNDIIHYFKNYEELGLRHSPIFQIFHIIFLNFFQNDLIFRIVNIHLNLSIVLIFFLSLNLKMKKNSLNNLLILISILFLMPSFRSYSIWPDSFLSGFIFFMLSVFYSLKFIESDKNKKNYYAYLNIIFLSISSYISPNFATFSIFYFYIFYAYFKFSRNLLKIIFLNIILSLPAFFYLFIMDNNFINTEGQWVNNLGTFSLYNLANKIIILPTIFIIYFIPFLIIYFNQSKQGLFLHLKKLNYYHYIIILLPFVFIKYFNYGEISKVLGGGGLFYNLLKFYNLIEIKLAIISSISIFVILLFSANNLRNSIFIICLILSSPQLTIYNVYFDLILFIYLFLFFNNNLFETKKILKQTKYVKIFFIYYFFILNLYIFKNFFYNLIQNI